jgi:ABC-type lipoprotein export system ATPase subunit
LRAVVTDPHTGADEPTGDLDRQSAEETRTDEQLVHELSKTSSFTHDRVPGKAMSSSILIKVC